MVTIIVNTSNRSALPTNNAGAAVGDVVPQEEAQDHRGQAGGSGEQRVDVRGHRGNNPPATNSTIAAPNRTSIGLSANQLIDGPTKSRPAAIMA
jgi:hypothetical protein